MATEGSTNTIRIRNLIAAAVVVVVVVLVCGFLAIALARSSLDTLPAASTTGPPNSPGPTNAASTLVPAVSTTPTGTQTQAARTTAATSTVPASPTSALTTTPIASVSPTPTPTANPVPSPATTSTPSQSATAVATAFKTATTPTATNPVPTPTATPTSVGQFSVSGRAATADGLGVAGVDVAFSKADYRQDVTTGADGSFVVVLPSAGTYSFSGVGIVCAANNWFSGGGCNGYNLFVEIRVSGTFNVPTAAPISLLYARATTILQGRAGDGTTQVFARATTGASGWSIDITNDGALRIGLIPGTWTLQAQTFSPSYSSGAAVTVTITEGQPAPFVDLPGPP